MFSIVGRQIHMEKDIVDSWCVGYNIDLGGLWLSQG